MYLDQINTTGNFIDGEGSNLLACIGLTCHSYEDINTIQFQTPEYKLLQNGVINTLDLTVRDEQNNILDNYELPIYISVEIK